MYQKMISYVYEYRNGERGKNIGFTKLALQNQNYKIKIQLRFSQGGRNELAVYGFIRGDGIIHTACFGNVKVENGFGDVLLSGNGANLWKDKNFMNMSGFLFVPKRQLEYGSISNFCATQWDDAPIDINTLDLLQNTKSRQSVIAKESFKQPEVVLHVAELVGGAESPEMTDCLKQPGDILVENQQVVNESVEIQMLEGESLSENPDVVEIKALHGKEESEMSPVQEADDAKGEAFCSNKVNASENSWDMFEQRRRTMRKKWENMQQECKSDTLEWKQGEEILRNFPVMNPFFDKEVSASVRIEPKDLGKLPMEHWYLANNSFLLHGYYYYRHLLFLKMYNRQEYMYAIAVPGNNDYRENFMANMFGFEQFKMVQNQNNAGFGYWWRRIV